MNSVIHRTYFFQSYAFTNSFQVNTVYRENGTSRLQDRTGSELIENAVSTVNIMELIQMLKKRR